MPFKVLKGKDVAPYIKAVCKNADREKVALGFWPEGAYSEAAAAGRLLVAVEVIGQQSRLAGHLLYGGTYPHIHIHQTYVVRRYRRKHIGSLLVQTLVRDAENAGHLTISARVATDLSSANAFWESQGFPMVRSKPGGTSRGRMLNVRVRELESPRLFAFEAEPPALKSSFVPTYVHAGVGSYAIDVNVFLDLMKARANADQARNLLSASWMGSVHVFVSEEFIEELSRAAKTREIPFCSTHPLCRVCRRYLPA